MFAVSITLFNNNLQAQAPVISYTPSTNVYTVGTAIPTLTPTTIGTVAAFAFGPSVALGGATLSNPYGMGIDPSGNVYVANYGNNTISEYNAAGSYVGTFGTGGTISNPVGIAFDNSGNAFLLNYHRTNNGLGNHHGNSYVDEYTVSTGVFSASVITGLGTATGIAIDATPSLYIAEGSYNSGSATVSEFNNTGALAFSLSNVLIANPVGTAVDGSGNIYELDGTNGNVLKFDANGTYLSTVITGLSTTLGATNLALSICLDGSGNIYIGDPGTHTVKAYTPAGTLLTTITGTTDPQGLVVDSKGDLFVSDYTNNTVTEYPPIGGYHLSGLLPAGLAFNSTTGVFTGTPTAGFSATTYTITAYNGSGSGSTTVTLSCPVLAAAPTISYNPAINVFTTNTAITPLTPITTNSPTSYSLTGTLPTGLSFSTSTGIFSGTPTVTQAATLYTVTATNATGSASTKISITSVIDDFWTGKKSNDWNTKQNWSTGSVPGPLNIASIGVIDYTGPDPVVNANTPAYYVTFGATHAASLTVNSGFTLTINNILTINLNATPTFKGSGTISIVPAGVVTANGALTINSPLTVTLQSTSAGSATVGQISTGSIIGTVSVQRFITGGTGYRGYRLLSSPVYGSTTAGLVNVFSVNYLKNSCFVKGTTGTTGGFDATGNPTVFLFREDITGTNTSFLTGNYRGINTLGTTPNYSYLIDIDGGPYNIPAGDGFLFFFRGDRNAVGQTVATESVSTYVPTGTTLTATGTLNQGAIPAIDWYTIGSTFLGYTSGGIPSIEGFNLVGNPYASTIDWDTYSTSVTTAGIYAPNIGPFVYVLDPLSQNFSVYKAGNHGLGATLSTNNTAANYIPSGHGFFVIASNASAQLTFNETAKPLLTQQPTTAIGNLLLGTPVQAALPQYLRLIVKKDSASTDGTLISFSDTATPNYDPKEDALYKLGNGAVSISSISADNVGLAINTLQLPKQNAISIPLNVVAYANATYQLDLLSVERIPDLYDIWLMDAYKKDSVNIRANRIYSFDVITADPTSYGSKRFTLIIRQNPALALQLLNFTASKSSTGSQIIWKTKNEQNYTFFTVERSTDGGKTFAEIIGSVTSSGLGTYSLLDKTPLIQSPNTYRLKLEDLNGTITYSTPVTLTYGDLIGAGNSISIYPNPVKNSINLNISKITGSNAGLGNVLYAIKIVNSAGIVVKTGTSNQQSWQSDVDGLSPGIYFIQVTNSTDKSEIGRGSFIKL